jgi:hypothetical protein
MRIPGAMRILPGAISGLARPGGSGRGSSGRRWGRPGLRVAEPPHAAATDVDRADLTFTARDGREPGRPIVPYGHSLGGLVTALYAIERSETGAGPPTAPSPPRRRSPRD